MDGFWVGLFLTALVAAPPVCVRCVELGVRRCYEAVSKLNELLAAVCGMRRRKWVFH